MAAIEKHGDDTVYYIRHNMRGLPEDKMPSNLEIDPERSPENFSLVKRYHGCDIEAGDTRKTIHEKGMAASEQINAYRHQIEDEVFHYNRKNLVKSIEVVVTLPEDVQPGHEREFFQASYDYIVSTLPMGERCVFLAEVHYDEGHVQKDGVTVVEGKPHMHVMYVPGVPDPKHHDGKEFKLSAYELVTNRTSLCKFHPAFQKYLKNAGVQGTVYGGGGGKSISVSTLKAITKEYGVTLEDLKNFEAEKTLKAELQKEVGRLSAEVDHQKDIIAEKDATEMIFKENIKEELMAREKEYEKLSAEVTRQRDVISVKDGIIRTIREEAQKEQIKENPAEKIQILQSRIADLEKVNAEKDRALEQAQERIRQLEAEKAQERERQQAAMRQKEQEKTWGNTSSWGRQTGWGDHTVTHESEEKLW